MQCLLFILSQAKLIGTRVTSIVTSLPFQSNLVLRIIVNVLVSNIPPLVSVSPVYTEPSQPDWDKGALIVRANKAVPEIFQQQNIHLGSEAVCFILSFPFLLHDCSLLSLPFQPNLVLRFILIVSVTNF